MFPKDLIHNLVLLRGGGTFRKWGLVKGSSITGAHPEEDIGILAPSISFSFSFTMNIRHVLLCYHRSKATGPSNLD
jgi:hypothetical protein